jgi:glycosyltransferase involved in cell wall biosynthesis
MSLPKRQAVIVLGMHRSGTSALAGVLSLMGARLPTRLMPAGPGNPKGYFEPGHIVTIHDRILAAAGTSWAGWERIDSSWQQSEDCLPFVDELAAAVIEDYGESGLFMLKDPRMCRLMPLWFRVLERIDTQASFMLPFRNPVEVARSVRQREGLPLPHGCVVWLRCMLDAEHQTRGHQRAFLSYGDFVADPRAAITGLVASLGVDWPQPLDEVAGEIRAFVEPGLRHQVADDNAIGDIGDHSQWLHQTLDCYETLARGNDNCVLARLDALRAEFDTADALFTPVWKHDVDAHAVERRAADIRREADRHQADAAALRSLLSGRDQEIAALGSALRANEAKVTSLGGVLARAEAELAKRDMALAAHRSETADRDKALAAHRSEIADRDKALAAHRSEIADRDKALAAHRSEIADRDKALAAHRSEIADRDKALAAHRSEIADRDSRLASFDRELGERNAQNRALTIALAGAQARATSTQSALQATVATFRNSTSWRLTAPVRAAGQLFARVRLSTIGYPLGLGWKALRARSVAPLREWRAARLIAGSGLFDGGWYLRNNPDVAAARLDPVRHYVAFGAREGRDPSPSFGTRTYLERYPDVAAAGLNPLAHFAQFGQLEGRISRANERLAVVDAVDQRAAAAVPRTLLVVSPTPPGTSLETDPTWHYVSREAFEADCRILSHSGLFDPDFYRPTAGIGEETDPVDHYLREGWRVGYEPGPRFEGASLYPYFRSGGHAGPPAITYLSLRVAGKPNYATLDIAEHWAALIRTSPLFDGLHYVTQIERIGSLDPALHYVIVGEPMGIAPSSGFDPVYYRRRYPDIAVAAVSPLAHYLTAGRSEGRRPLSVGAHLRFEPSRIDRTRETILLISHDASRTGAPILAWNIARQLRRKYNVVALLLGGGDLVKNFKETCAAVVGPLVREDWHVVDTEYLIPRLLDAYPITYAIVNSIESRTFMPALAAAFVPVVALIHEFASYTHPRGAMGEGLDWPTQIVFSTDLTLASAKREHPHLWHRPVHVLPQGRCLLPPTRGAPARDVNSLRERFRPKGFEHALVVLGAGHLHIRKGVELFLSCAAQVAALAPKRPVRFVWIGGGYDPENDTGYSSYLAEQIVRSGLEELVSIVEPIDDLDPAYAMTDVFFLSSRLDPLPNVTIDAASCGIPVVCFAHASGMAALMSEVPMLRDCVVPHVDVEAAARVIAGLANDEERRRRVGAGFLEFAEMTFNLVHYVSGIDELGRSSLAVMQQRAQDFLTLQEDRAFDEDLFLPHGVAERSREYAIRQFITRWAAVTTSRKPAKNYFFRRPCVGFHPQIYAEQNAARYDGELVNPLAHYIRSGKPNGAWLHDVVTVGDDRTAGDSGLRAALHVHFYYPEFAKDFLRKFAVNRSPIDLLVSTDTSAKARELRKAFRGYDGAKPLVRVVPNRGRDIGPFLSAFGDVIMNYEVVGHIHGKRSAWGPEIGDRWREFLWQHLLGDKHPMADIILRLFAADQKLGLVFAEESALSDWDDNLEIAKALASKMGLSQALPRFFEFPGGTMFWARPRALKRMFALNLSWDDYPSEPLPMDGTILHALERLLPFVAREEGYSFLTTHLPGVKW